MSGTVPARLESLLAVDDAVAAIVGELARSGVLAETLIIFTSDNGFLHGEHRIPAGKIYLYRPSSRVPLVMRGRASRRACVCVSSSRTSIWRRRSSSQRASSQVG